MHRYPFVNTIMLTGELVEEPVYADNANGEEVVNFVLANNRRFKSRSGEWKEKTVFVQITAWRSLAQACKDFLTKGSVVFVRGELEQSKWNAANGEKRQKLQVVADKVDFLDARTLRSRDGEESIQIDKSNAGGEETPCS
jgi:single-strand DNA-binding protein